MSEIEFNEQGQHFFTNVAQSLRNLKRIDIRTGGSTSELQARSALSHVIHLMNHLCGISRLNIQDVSYFLSYYHQLDLILT
jgi:hypothetical protein